jgi:hypothetical protein
LPHFYSPHFFELGSRPGPLIVPAAAICAWLQAEPKQTVDGFHPALEIVTRSSYVPSAPIGVHSGSATDCAPNTHARLESPVWMK